MKSADNSFDKHRNLKVAGFALPHDCDNDLVSCFEVRHKPNPVPATKKSSKIEALNVECFACVKLCAFHLNTNSTFDESPPEMGSI